MKKKVKTTLAFALILLMAVTTTGNAFALNVDNNEAAYSLQVKDQGTLKINIVSIFFAVGNKVYCQSEVPAGFAIYNAYGVMAGTYLSVDPITDVSAFISKGTYQMELMLFSGGVWVHTGNFQPLIVS